MLDFIMWGWHLVLLLFSSYLLAWLMILFFLFQFNVFPAQKSWISVCWSFVQLVIWFIIPATRTPRTDHKNNALALIVLIQYIPRLYLIFPLSSEIIKATGVVTKTAWAGAAYNLLLYMLASHVHNLITSMIIYYSVFL